jgi:uncharacterized protein (TIRG00374 family)
MARRFHIGFRRKQSAMGSDDGELFGIEKKKAIFALVGAAALSLGAVAAIGQVTSFSKLEHALAHATKWWLPLCLLGQVVAFSGYVVAYRAVAAVDDGPRFRYRAAGRIVGLGLGAYVLGSAAGGLGVDFWAMHTAGAETHDAARRTLALNTLQAAALGLLASIAGVVLLLVGVHGHTALVMALVWIVVFPAAVVAAAFASGPRLAPRLTNAPEGESHPHTWSPGPWLPWLGAKARKALADAVGGVVLVRRVVAHPTRFAAGLVGYPLFWIGDFFTLYAAVRAFTPHADPAALVVAEATAWALSFLPLPAGGSGAAEATMTFTLHAVGVPVSEALSAALVYRATNFWLPILPALALLPGVPRLQEELQGLASGAGTPREEGRPAPARTCETPSGSPTR